MRFNGQKFACGVDVTGSMALGRHGLSPILKHCRTNIYIYILLLNKRVAMSLIYVTTRLIRRISESSATGFLFS